MISIKYLFANWWLRLSLKAKATAFFILFLLGVLVYKSVQYSVLKYRYFKEKEQQVEIYKDSLKVSQRRIDLLINSAKNENIRVIEKIKYIDRKLKKDEEIITNIVYSDAELKSFLTDYEKRAKNIQNQ